MSCARDIFRSNNALIQKYGQDAAPEAPSSGNVRYGSKADIRKQDNPTSPAFAGRMRIAALCYY